MREVSPEYLAKEESIQRQPVEIYHLWIHNGSTHWYYTSGDSPITYEGKLYIPATIDRDSVSYNSNLEVSTLNIRAAIITEPVSQYLVLNPIETIWLDVRKLFRDQTPYEAVVVFIGQIRSIAFRGGETQVECVGFEHYLKQQLPIFRYQPQCNNFLFDERCSLNKAVYAVAATLGTASTDGTVLTSATFSGFPTGYFTLGYLHWGDYYRHIVKHEGSEIILKYILPGIESGFPVTVYPGCNLDPITCRDKFNNVLNFFGHPYIPIKNPVMGL